MSNVVSDEQQIAALQGEIREAGETVRDLRLILGWMVVTPLIAVPVAALCRVCQQRRLFGLVAALDEQTRAAALVPLEAVRLRDTRKIVAPLLRRFRLSTELAPATAPDARGDEARPTERGR